MLVLQLKPKKGYALGIRIDQESSFLSSLDDNLDGILIITGDNIKLGDIKNTSDNRNEFQEYSDRPN